MQYDSLNKVVLSLVPADASRILDLGCGVGTMGEYLKRSRNCSVTGVTFDEQEAGTARRRLDAVEVADLNTLDLKNLGRFDCVLCCHVLEHLFQPDVVLSRIADCLLPNATLIVALPNILFWRQRFQLLKGAFTYTHGGLMDETHYRFFDWVSAHQLLGSAGYSVTQAIADGGFPLSRFLWPFHPEGLDRFALRICPGLFGWQFVFRCERAQTSQKPDFATGQLSQTLSASSFAQTATNSNIAGSNVPS